MQERNMQEFGYSNSKVVEARSRSPAKKYAETNPTNVGRLQSTAAGTSYGRTFSN